MFYPMFTMVLLTIAVGVYLLSLRVRAVKHRQVSIGYFRLNSGAQQPPAPLLAAANHFSNQFEVPVLFYVTCLTAMIMGMQGPLLTGLAWVFVASRVIHTMIHLTYNNVIHRMLTFWIGVICVLAIWVLIAITIN